LSVTFATAILDFISGVHFASLVIRSAKQFNIIYSINWENI